MFKKICAVCLVFGAAALLLAAPVFSQGNNYDYLMQKFASSPKENWDNLIAENKDYMTKDFLAGAFDLAVKQIRANDKNAALYAEAIDYIDYYYSGKKTYRGMALYFLGAEYLNIKNYDSALKCAQAMNPGCARGYVLLGRIKTALNNLSGAEEDFNKAIKADPGFEDAHYFFARLYVLKNDLKGAQKEFEETLKINPEKAEAKDAMAIITGQTVMKGSENKEAMDHFNKAEDFFGAQKYKEALEEYKLAIKADPKFAKAYTYMGDAYYALDNKKEAIVNYRKAIEIDPNDRQAHRFLGNALESLYDETGDVNYLNEAIGCYENAIKVDPKYFSAQKDLDGAKNKKSGIK